MSIRLILLLVVVSLTSACTAVPKHRVHHEFAAAPEARAPKKVLIMPVDVEISEISAGGVTEEVPEWSEAGRQNVRNAIAEHAANEKRLKMITTPVLTDAEQKIVDDHLALYDLVAGSAFLLSSFGGEPWRHKVHHFDYTLGDGLKFLRDKTGADAALFVIGSDQISSAERQATIVAAAIFGIGLPPGVSFITTGVVDLQTGDILWLNYSASVGNKDLRKASDASDMVAEMLADYPGIDAYNDTQIAGQ